MLVPTEISVRVVEELARRKIYVLWDEAFQCGKIDSLGPALHAICHFVSADPFHDGGGTELSIVRDEPRTNSVKGGEEIIVSEGKVGWSVADFSRVTGAPPKRVKLVHAFRETFRFGECINIDVVWWGHRLESPVVSEIPLAEWCNSGWACKVKPRLLQLWP